MLVFSSHFIGFYLINIKQNINYFFKKPTLKNNKKINLKYLYYQIKGYSLKYITVNMFIFSYKTIGRTFTK